MRHLFHLSICLGLGSLLLLTGCGRTTTPAKKPPARDDMAQRQPDDGDSEDVVENDDPTDAAENETAANPPAAAAPRGYQGGRMRNGDQLSAGGGSRAPRRTNSGAQASTPNPRPPLGLGGRNPNPRGSNNNATTFAGGGLANGFYPQIPTDGTTYVATGTLSNGFYPQNMGDGAGGAGGASSPATFVSTPAPGAATDKLREQAIAAFQERDEAKGFQYLYSYLLTSDAALKKYPLMWYPELSQPRVAFRWGVGVVYTNNSDDESPLVIGDPTGERITEPTPRNNRGNTRGNRNNTRGTRGGSRRSGGGSGGMESEDGPAPGGNSSSSSSDYTNVDVENPEGFLLYYTGDFGDRLLSRLESRRTHNDAYYGAILRDLDVKFTAETTEPARASRNTNQRGQRNGDNLSAGGGARGGARRNNAPGGAGQGGAAAGNDGPSERLSRVQTNSPASSPAADTMGTLIPGVMLVGKGSKAELIERAQNLGLDGLMIISLRVSSGRKSVGSSSLRVINLKASERKYQDVFTSRTLKTDVVAEKRKDNSDPSKDPVELALDEVFQKVADIKFKAAPLPDNVKTNPAAIEKRVRSLVETKPADILPVAAEIMSFHSQGLLSDDVAKQTLSQLMGGVLGEVMIDGTAKERAEIVERFIKNDVATSGSSFR